MKSKKRILILLLLIVIISSPKKYYANSSNNTGSLKINSAANVSPGGSIQDAINAASAGDTINVAAGTFGENLTVNKAVILLGANHDNDPAGSIDRSNESIISGGQVEVTAAATFNGFKLDGNRIWIHGASDAVVTYNIVVNSSTHGIYIDASSPNANVSYNTVSSPAWQGISNQGNSGVVISYNQITGVDTQQPIESTNHTGTGIQITNNVISGCTNAKGINYWGGTGPNMSFNNISGTTNEAIFSDTKTNTIEGNTLSNIGGPGIQIFPPQSHGAVADTSEKSVIKDNVINSTRWQGITVFGHKHSDISGNTLTGCNYYGADGTGDWDYAGIHVENMSGFSSDSSTISGNTVTDGINGIQVWASNCTITNNTVTDMGKTYADEKTVGSRTYKNSAFLVGSNFGTSDDVDPQGTVVKNNNMSGNYWGLFHSTDLSNSVNAESNWWGDKNPSDQVMGNVDFIPFLDKANGSDTFPPVQNQTDSKYYFTIQEAIDSSNSGDIITVAAGKYEERIVIDKPLTLRGATYNLNKNGYTVPSNYSWDETVESIISNPEPALTTSNLVDIINTDNVTFEGFVVQSLNALSGSKNDHLLRVYAQSQTLNNTIVRNNIIGPNTNTSGQDGTNGRMGLYLATPNYGNYDIKNSTFSGNKIFDCKGNGNNIFIWGGAEAYLSGERAELTGTVIEDNEIYGSHRSGIEIAGGVDDLTIKNNKIYNNSSTAADDSTNLKYGNGILIIRMGSDKTSSTGYGANNITIEDNEIYNNEKNGIYLGPINSNYTIKSNSIYNNGFNGIIVDLEENYHGGTSPVYDKISNIKANNNAIHNNTLNDGTVTGTPTNSFTLDAKSNWWGDSNPADQVSGIVDFSPWWAGNYLNDPHSLPWTWATNSIIQAAIDSASAGDIVNVSAGTYNDTLLITKRISLVGAGSNASGTTIQSTSPPTVTGGSTYPSGYRPVIRLNGSGIAGDSLLIKDIRIRPRQDLVGASHPHPGILFEPNASISYVKLDNVHIVGTEAIGTPEMGVVADGSTSLNHFSITNSEFADMGYGLIFFNDVNSPTTFQNFIMSRTTLHNNSLKGFYSEKLSDATFNNLTVTNNGDTLRSPSWADKNNAGIDINLKFGSYQNLTFNNLTVSSNGIGSENGSGITVKARDNGSYSSSPATLSGVNITKCVFSNNTNSISFGEPNQSNAGPSVMLVNNNSLTGSTLGILDLRGSSADTIDATGNWWGIKDGPDDNSGDGTTSHNISTGEKIFELTDKKITYAPWYSVNPEDNTSQPGVTQQSPKVFLVKESVPFLSKGYVNRGIQLASLSFVDTIDVQIANINEVPSVDRKIVLKFVSPPVLDSLDITGDLELTGDITISGGLNLSGGNILTGDTSKVVLDSTVTKVVETSTARIIGTVEVKPRAVGTGTMQLLGLEIKSGADDLGKVSFTRKSGNDGVVNVSGNTGVGMTWEISTDNQPSSGREVKFSWLSEFDNGVDPSSVIVYRNTGSGWEYFAGPLDASGNPREVTVTVSGFSDWTIGSSSAPLPVQLTDFSGKINKSKVELSWKTETEMNNYGFEIQRQNWDSSAVAEEGTQNAEFEKIGFVEGFGTSNSPKSYEFTDANPVFGELQYRLKQIDTDGAYAYYSTIVKVSFGITSVDENGLPTEYKLMQNYPNPFNPNTTIKFQLPSSGNVQLKVFDILGNEVIVLMDEYKTAGSYEVLFDANSTGNELTSGIYFYEITSEKFKKVRKMMLLK